MNLDNKFFFDKRSSLDSQMYYRFSILAINKSSSQPST